MVGQYNQVLTCLNLVYRLLVSTLDTMWLDFQDTIVTLTDLSCSILLPIIPVGPSTCFFPPADLNRGSHPPDWAPRLLANVHSGAPRSYINPLRKVLSSSLDASTTPTSPLASPPACPPTCLHFPLSPPLLLLLER